MNATIFKKLGIFFIIWLFYTSILFIGIMFTKANINPFEWEERTRAVLTYLSLFPFCLGLFMTILFNFMFEKNIKNRKL